MLAGANGVGADWDKTVTTPVSASYCSNSSVYPGSPKNDPIGACCDDCADEVVMLRGTAIREPESGLKSGYATVLLVNVEAVKPTSDYQEHEEQMLPSHGDCIPSVDCGATPPFTSPSGPVQPSDANPHASRACIAITPRAITNRNTIG